jgi:hypothetical protein
MINQRVKITGRVRFIHRAPDGRVIEDVTHKNAIVTTGLDFLASRAVDAASLVMSHIGLGSGVVAVAPADTALGTELARVVLDSATSVSNTIIYVATFGPGVGTGAVTEAGTFNAGVAGTMLNRLVFPVINKGALDTVEVEWTVTFADDGV